MAINTEVMRERLRKMLDEDVSINDPGKLTLEVETQGFLRKKPTVMVSGSVTRDHEVDEIRNTISAHLREGTNLQMNVSVD